MDHLAPVDLSGRIRLALNALLGLLDASQRHRPHWAIGLKDGALLPFQPHGGWDLCHDVARALHAIGMVEQTLGVRVEDAIWRDLAEQQYALFAAGDDLPGTVDDRSGNYFVHLHNIRESTHGLTALIRRGDARAQTLCRAMVRRVLAEMDPDGTIYVQRLPAYVSAYTSQPHQEGRAIDALVRYYRLTGDDAALDLAQRMAAYALAHCFAPEGRILEEAGSHGHSLTAILAGMLDLALLTGDGDMLLRCKAIYDVGMPRFNSTFGWSMESLQVHALRGESNNTGDLLRAALLLGRAGWPNYLEHAERILRGHLLPSQVLDVSDLPDDASDEEALSRRASRLRGGWSFPTPSAYVLDKDSPLVTYDITSGAADGLCEALRATITSDAVGVRVNLLLSQQAEGVRVVSRLPREGRLEITNRSGRALLVRIPSWVAAGALEVVADGQPVSGSRHNGYLTLAAAVRDVTLAFPVAEKRTRESITYVTHTIDWRGDQIVAMSPCGVLRPMFPACTD
jgi:hypothetical protein